ncbi:MAG: twin-arginine translocase TatA/TatE family subunit [Acidimicrobiales bacterium]
MIANIFGPDLGIVVVIIIVVLLGGSQLPKIARNVGTAGKEFRKAQQEAEHEAAEREKAKADASPPPPLAVTAPPPPVAVPPAASGMAGDDSVHLSRSQLDELLRSREEQVRREAGGNAN